MITIKSRIDKTAVLKKLRKIAENLYKDCYEEELKIEAFMQGVKELIHVLREQELPSDDVGGYIGEALMYYRRPKKKNTIKKVN